MTLKMIPIFALWAAFYLSSCSAATRVVSNTKICPPILLSEPCPDYTHYNTLRELLEAYGSCSLRNNAMILAWKECSKIN